MDEPFYAYRSHTFHELEEYRRQIGAATWRNMEVKVYRALNRLRPGHHYDIAAQVPEAEQELFVKCCCLYILEQPDESMTAVAFRDGKTIKRYNIYGRRPAKEENMDGQGESVPGGRDEA